MRTTITPHWLLSLSLLFLPNWSWSQARLAITGATVVPMDGGASIADGVVLVEAERIVAVGARTEVVIPDDTELLDVSGTWLVPGLVNLHVHLGLVLPGNMAADLADETEVELAFRMADNARKTLMAGVTTIRLPGDTGHVDIALDRAIKKGEVDGPRIFSAGEMVDITAGHGASGETHDGPYELRKAVRGEIGAGARWIKIAISGGIASPRGEIAEALMTPDEIEAVIDAAHRFGAKVTAHSGSPQATLEAVEVGIDCIEHGYFLTRDVLQKMARRGTWLVPTIVVSQPATRPFFERIGSPDWYLTRWASVGVLHFEALSMAIEEGVSIALGTDQFPFEPNDGTIATVREAEYYVEAGMTPVEALRSATSGAAELLEGPEPSFGSLSAGKYADLIAVGSDPTKDISALREIRLVVKGGKIYRNQLKR